MGLMFLPEQKNEKSQINHIDGNKTNNKLSNLEWCSPKENINHAWSNGLAQARKGSTNNWAKLNETQVIEIAKMFEQKEKGVEIAKKFGVSAKTISAIKQRKNWRQITQNFSF